MQLWGQQIDYRFIGDDKFLVRTRQILKWTLLQIATAEKKPVQNKTRPPPPVATVVPAMMISMEKLAGETEALGTIGHNETVQTNKESVT
jgi:hypothetical protein